MREQIRVLICNMHQLIFPSMEKHLMHCIPKSCLKTYSYLGTIFLSTHLLIISIHPSIHKYSFEYLVYASAHVSGYEYNAE